MKKIIMMMTLMMCFSVALFSINLEKDSLLLFPERKVLNTGPNNKNSLYLKVKSMIYKEFGDVEIKIDDKESGCVIIQGVKFNDRLLSLNDNTRNLQIDYRGNIKFIITDRKIHIYIYKLLPYNISIIDWNCNDKCKDDIKNKVLNENFNSIFNQTGLEIFTHYINDMLRYKINHIAYLISFSNLK